MKRSSVLIVGAGPSGLALSSWLKAFGLDVRIVDAASGPGTTSLALAVQARHVGLAAARPGAEVPDGDVRAHGLAL